MAALKKLKTTFSKSKAKTRALGTFSYNGRVYLYFQLSSDLKSQFHVATSTDGFSFELEKRKLYIKKGIATKEDIKSCNNFNISEYAGYFLMVYVRKEGKKNILEKAWSRDLIAWTYEGNMIPLSSRGIVVSNYTHKGKSYLYSSEKSITAYSSSDLIHWKKENKEILLPRDNFFDSGELNVECVINSEKGILLLYDSASKEAISVGMALCDKNNPTHVLWRNREPLWVEPKEWKSKSVILVGSTLHKGNILAYWQVQNKEIYVAVYAVYKISDGHTSKDISLKLKRPRHNPLIAPRGHNSWEAFNTFNPAAMYDEGKVHILYRAQGYDYVSTLGYATSKDGIHIDERLDYPVYTPSRSFEIVDNTKPFEAQYVSGGGYGGCEDPRITRIDDRYYLTYVAFDGANPPRVALTSISVDNFLNRRWLWERPVLISLQLILPNRG